MKGEGVIKLGSISILMICSFCISCNSTATKSEQSSETTTPLYHIPDQMTVTGVRATRDANNGTVVEGTTNLPDGTKLGVELLTGHRTTHQDFQVYVIEGKFHSAGFRNASSPLPPGKQKVHILTYFNNLWQSESILNLLSEGGKRLKTSSLIHSEDSQLIDADKQLDYVVVLTIPPAVRPAPPRPESETEKVIKIVKKAVVTVDGGRSSQTVGWGVQYYCTSPGVRMGKGWDAIPIGDHTYNVTLDFIDESGSSEEHHATALWEVDSRTKKVLYRNKYAKHFSWVP